MSPVIGAQTPFGHFPVIGASVGAPFSPALLPAFCPGGEQDPMAFGAISMRKAPLGLPRQRPPPELRELRRDVVVELVRELLDEVERPPGFDPGFPLAPCRGEAWTDAEW
ncbi:hypothetical protein AB0M80_36620 [Amycolatopsis sp. NPDC051045]|uniref:hypothetical protein n=1 Tax=Amycolatopsis sp. NPDC051045 TaxID=3156922 RepID=UPI003444DBB0